jgi:hypothetical protein
MNCEDTLSRSLSNELNADPAFLTPEHAAGEMQSVSRNCQAERCRDADRGRDVERRAVRGDVAQSIALPPNSIVPLFKTRCRGAAILLSTAIGI